MASLTVRDDPRQKRVKTLDSALAGVPDCRVKVQQLREHRAATVGAAIIIPFLVAAALVPFRDSVTPATDVLVLVAVVVAFGTTGLRSAGLAAALSAAAAFDFFLTEPYQSSSRSTTRTTSKPLRCCW